MSNVLLDTLGQVGYALDTPGAYLRGVLAGRPGDRASGEELLSSYGVHGGPLGGLAAEMVVDPLTLLPPAWGAYKGTQALTKGARALGGAMSPLARLAEEAVESPLTRRLGELAGPSPLDRRLGELGGLADPMDRLRAGYRHTAGAPGPDPLTRAMGLFGDETGAVPSFPYHPDEVASLTGRRATHIAPDEALAAYDPWVKGLSPEEAASVKMYTSGPQARISDTLRGGTWGGAGDPIDVWDGIVGRIEPGTIPLRTPDDVRSEVLPYLDSALSRGDAPRDLLTYRLAGRYGDLTPRSAAGMVGRTVSDPSYVSTTVDPYGRFYGRSANPKDLAMDVVMPRGGAGGYADALSRWDKEKELILPRDAAMRVADVRKAPVEKIGYEWYRLDPEGKPIPRQDHFGVGLHSEDAGERTAEVMRAGAYNDTVVPDYLMDPDWRGYRERNLQSTGEQTGVLMEMLGNGMAPHHPAVARPAPGDLYGPLREAIGARAGHDPGMLKMLLRGLDVASRKGEYPNDGLFSVLQQLGYPAWDLLRSTPR